MSRHSFLAFAAGTPIRGTFDSIVNRVCAEYGVTPAQMVSKATRQARFCAPRAEIMLRAKKAGFSTTEIGRRLGGRDHTTIIHGQRAAIKRRVGVRG